MSDKKSNKILYKSLPRDMSPHGHKFRVGRWYHEDNISICERGFHASTRAIDAMNYVNCEILAKVEVKGESQIKDNKQCWSDIKIIKTYKWIKKDSIAMAIYAAEMVIDLFEKEYPEDKRPRLAIEAAKQVLKKDTKKARDAARDAAGDAAWAADWAAWAAAWAARAAAWAAAGAAAWAAGDAAWDAGDAAGAARDAAGAARDAAWAAAGDAGDAAGAAGDAAGAAGDAAYEQILDKIEAWIHERIGF